MKPHGEILGIIMGCVCLLFSLIPGLFHDLADGLRNLLNSSSPSLPVRIRRSEDLQRPIWLAVIGALLIALSLFSHLSN